MPTVTSASVRRFPPILHVVASGGLYGIERMLLALLPALRARGWNVVLASLNEPNTPGGRLGQALEASAVPVDYVHGNGRVSLRGLWNLHRTIRRYRPGLLHVHGYKATILAGGLNLIGRTPTVATFHTEATKAVGLDFHVKVESRVLRHAAGVAAVSRPIAHELRARGVAPERIRIIPNGIPDPVGRRAAMEPSTSNGDTRNLLFLGRLVEGKNVRLLVEAVAKLRDEFPGIRLEIVGDGPARAGLESCARNLGLGDSVRFLGYMEEVYEPLARCDCFVLPSRTEGMPISLLEAMAVGTGILSTAVGSIPEVVRHGREAILVPPDRPDSLLAGLRDLLREGGLRRRLGKNARQRFEQEFTADRMADRYASFYAEVLRTPMG